jgi:hypothetical protein
MTKQRNSSKSAAPKKSDTMPAPNKTDKTLADKPAENKAAKAAESAISVKAKGLFKTHPKADQLFFTSDGTAFFEEQHARVHARGLADQHVEHIKREV